MNACSAYIKWILVTLAIVSKIAIADDSSDEVAPMLRSTRNCRGYRYIPFAITNIAAKRAGRGKVKYSYHSRGTPTKLFFLKDVTLCDGFMKPYLITGTELNPDQFKSEVKSYIDSNEKYHVLYNIHGFNVDPLASYEGAADYNDNNKDYLVIPIQWRQKWGASFPSYEYDRNNRAPLMGKLLAEKFSVFQANYPTSIMCHSTGNYVFQVFAQNVDNPTTVFRNFFSVAADARMDMFSSEFNPDTNTMHEDNKKAFSVDIETDLGIPFDETKPNGGIAISKLATNTHVIWNFGDHALHIRETFQIGGGDGLRKALGKWGDQSKKAMDTYFVDRVKFHNFSAKVREFGMEHIYQWYEPTKLLYKQYISIDIATANKQEDLHFKPESS